MGVGGGELRPVVFEGGGQVRNGGFRRVEPALEISNDGRGGCDVREQAGAERLEGGETVWCCTVAIGGEEVEVEDVKGF